MKKKRVPPPPPSRGPCVTAVCEGLFGCRGEWFVGDEEKHEFGCKATGRIFAIGISLLFGLLGALWFLGKFREMGLFR